MQQSTQSAGSETAPNRVLDHGLHHLKLNHSYILRPILELRASSRTEDLLEEWRRAPRPSPAWRSGLHSEQSLDVRNIIMSMPREEAEQLVWEHIAEKSSISVDGT